MKSGLPVCESIVLASLGPNAERTISGVAQIVGISAISSTAQAVDFYDESTSGKEILRVPLQTNRPTLMTKLLSAIDVPSGTLVIKKPGLGTVAYVTVCYFPEEASSSYAYR